MTEGNYSNASGTPRELALELCAREILADMEQLGVGNATRDVNGADAVDLLNHYLPQLRRAVSGVHR